MKEEDRKGDVVCHFRYVRGRKEPFCFVWDWNDVEDIIRIPVESVKVLIGEMNEWLKDHEGEVGPTVEEDLTADDWSS